MEIEKLIRFEKEEKRGIEAVARSVTIAFEGDEADEARRRLNGLANGGEAVSASRLEKAQATCIEIEKAIDTDLKHYRRLRDNPPPADGVGSDGAIPVIADTRQMASVLVESRELQKMEVVSVLMLLRNALHALGVTTGTRG